MNDLEKKFYKYLIDKPFLFNPQEPKKIAKALAKIAVGELDSAKLLERETKLEKKLLKKSLKRF